MSPEELQPIPPKQISQTTSDLLVSWHRLWSSVWPTDFILDSSLGFVQASQGRSLCSFGGSSSPGVRYALGHYHAGRQNIDPNHLLLQIAWGVFQNLLVVCHFQDSFDPDEIPSTKHTETSPQHYTPTSMFHSGNGVLWDEHLSLLTPKHRQYFYGQRALVLSNLTKGHVFRVNNLYLGCPLNFSLGGVSSSEEEFFLVSNLTVHSCPGL